MSCSINSSDRAASPINDYTKISRDETKSVNKFGETPLHIAVRKGNREAMMNLVANAEIHSVTLRDRTPLWYALCRCKQKFNEYNLNIVRDLVKHGGYDVIPQSEKESQFLKKNLEKEIFVLHDIVVPQTRIIDILSKTGANKKAMRELVDEKIKEYGEKIMKSHSWAYYHEACIILADPSDSSFERSIFHQEFKLPRLVTQPP